MEKVKMVKGRPLYIHKKRQYLSKPPKTKVYKMLYNEETGMTLCYCRRDYHFIEILSILIMLCCVYINHFVIDSVIDVNFSTNADYYDGMLFINVVNNSEVEGVKLTVLDSSDGIVYEQILNAKDTVPYIKIEEVFKTYTLKFSYGKEEVSKVIIVTNRSED